ncbi:MAG TPA: GNAT family N-acetyltransferase [Acidimicrobiales bacterium]|nr:GNAT family N-acetyltransferase [Acidimicrobiales bacterium]
MEEARQATAADLDPCRALLADALAGAAHLRGGRALVGPATTTSLMERWTVDPGQAALFVGEFHGVVVGLGAVVASGGPGEERGAGRIECCYVEPDARGVGVGSALMAAMVEWCARRECAAVDALALPGDRGTKQRLEAAGFTARLIVLSRPLD